ncbi:uncharacterized protein [Cherax quadricarinatus]|uniref:uncharacterized protein n=1 Tax=Cherax quadricarinatus TaxID=27406 RepID=UPI002378D065|nr:uncharacterized protein LOC128693222 [Cherax quadricarinatus]
MDAVNLVVEGSPMVATLLLAVLMPLTPAFTDYSGSLAPTHLSKLHNCLRKAAQVTMCNIVREIYSDERMFSASGTMSLTEYCKRMGIIPAFAEAHQHLLFCNLMMAEFDFSFGYDVLTKVCAKVYETLGEECRGKINDLRKMVNEEVFDEDAAAVVETFRRTQAAIYRGLGQVIQRDFSQNIATVEEILKSCLDSEIRCEEGQVICESDVTTSGRKSQLIMKGRSELSERYEKLRDLNPRTWAKRDGANDIQYFHIERTFTQLKIRESKKVTEVKDLLKLRNVSGEVPSTLLLCGLAGSGKTSLCRYLVFDWQRGGTEVDTLNLFHLVFLIEVRRVRSSRLREFLLDEVMPNTSAGVEMDHIIPALKELQVLFIIDGYDETDKISSELLEDIFAKFGDKRIIITTRPELHRDAVCLATRHEVDYLSLETRGFDTERRNEFTRKVFSTMEQDVMENQKQTKEFLLYIHERRTTLGSYLNLPLTSALLMLSWRHNPEVVNQSTTATRLYQEFYHLLQNKLAERLSKDYIGVNELPDVLDSLLLCLGEQAWTMLNESTVLISDDFKRKIEEECERKRIKLIELLSGFHMCHLHEDPDEWKLKISFLHDAQASYLAATFLAECLRKGKMKMQDIGNQVGASPGLEQVLLFLMGHLAFQNALTSSTVNDIFSIMKKLDIDPTNYDFWWNIFVESHRHPQVGTLLARDKLSHKHWQLNDTNAVSALRLLSFTPVKLASLTLDISALTEPYDIPSFIQALQEVGQNLKKRQKKPVKVELHLRRHNTCDIKTSNIFLKAVCSWGDLTSFTGFLGEQPDGEELLAGCCNLKTIRVRISTVEAFTSLSNSLKKIHKSVKSLHVTLALPGECPVEALSELRHNGNLEISVVATKDGQKEWMESIVKTIGGRGGCWRLSLPDCDMTYDGLEWLVTHLKGHVHDKISIETVG